MGEAGGRYLDIAEYIDTHYAPGSAPLSIFIWLYWMSGPGPIVASPDGAFAFPYDKNGVCAYRIGGSERLVARPTVEMRNRWVLSALTFKDGCAALWVDNERIDLWDNAPDYEPVESLLIMQNAAGVLGSVGMDERWLSDSDLGKLWGAVEGADPPAIPRPAGGGFDSNPPSPSSIWGIAGNIEMLRGSQVDLEASKTALWALLEIYSRDLRAGELSNGAISAVNTSIRSLEGALGKLANELDRRLGSGRSRPYFPIADDASKFNGLLERNLPGIRDNCPSVVEVIERQQPYHPDQRQLAHLKPLYRENHHHNFSLQQEQHRVSWDIRQEGQIVSAIHSGALDISPVAPVWQGIPTVRPNSHFDGPGMTDWMDWQFADHDISVFGTLRILHNLCVKACEEIWESVRTVT